ncbi:MAG TPA: TonB-dependent receptor, partial [Myxococcaceae bacterium]|nr:TonB-dependent receptor [Myxococcaceae bacterium]
SGQINFSDRQTPLSNYYFPISTNRPTDTLTQIYRVRLTYQPTAADRISLTFNLDHNTIDNLTGNGTVTEDAETKVDRGGIMIVANYDHSFTENTLFELQAGVTYKNVNNDPEHITANIGHFDLFNNVQTSNAGRVGFGQDENWLHEAKTRIQFDPSLIWKLHAHQMKAGVQVSYMLDSQLQGVYGDSRYTDHVNAGDTLCDPINHQSSCFERTDFYAGVDASGNGVNPGGPLQTNASALNLGAYFQDRWTVSRKLTIIPGLRADYGDMLGDPNSPPAPVLFGWGPRLSTTYDVFGDRKSLLTAHYGRSNDVGNIFIAQHANPALLEVNSFFTAGAFPACPANSAANTLPAGQCSYAGGVNGRSYALTPSGSRQQAPPYVDEIQLGYHQEIAPLTAVGIDVDYRHYGKMWVDEEVNRVWDPSGRKIIGYINGIPQSILVSRTSPLAFRNYEGVDLWIQGNPGRWDLYAAYTLSYTTGTVSGDYFDGFLSNPRMTVFSNGYVGEDHRHTIKGSISYNTPFGLDLGIRLRYQSGAPIWQSFINPADANLSWFRSPRGTGYPVLASTGQPNFNDSTQWAQLLTPDLFLIDLEARYNIGALLGLKQKIEIEAFVLDALDDYNAGGVTSFYSGTATNKFGFATFHNGPLQGEVILRFRN